MKVPEKFPEGSRFWASFSGDEFVVFPSGEVWKLEESGAELRKIVALPRSGCAPIEEAAFRSAAASSREFSEAAKAAL